VTAQRYTYAFSIGKWQFTMLNAGRSAKPKRPAPGKPVTDAQNDSYDVIVVGGGGTGLAAAIEAAGAGARTMLIEKNPALGGSTGWSVGSISVSATPHQHAKGVVDNPEDHWRDMALFNGALDGRDNPALRRILTEELPGTFAWLLSHGLRFYGPMPEPPHAKPRMHNVLPNSRSFIRNLERAARNAGAAIVTSARAEELLVSNGRVTAVACATPHGRRVFSAHRAVVLASGDFTNDPELKGRYMGTQETKASGVNPTATGDGQKLAVKLGARILNGDLALGPELRFVPPILSNFLQKLPPWSWLASFMAWSIDYMPPILLRPFIMSFVTTALAPSPNLFEAGALLINKNGERFTDERDKPALVLPDQPGGDGFILLDARIAKLFTAWPNFISTAPGVAYAYLADYRRNRRDVFESAATLEALGQKLGMPTGALARTVAAYNAKAGNRPPIGDGPYVVLGPARAVFVHNEGGLAVDHDHRVLGAGDIPIAGLYAAGATGQGGMLLKGHGHHLAWAFVSGRRAGRNAAVSR
jgi:succinate dehydrogenase/fumarate reductase flavoprotein subunit